MSKIRLFLFCVFNCANFKVFFFAENEREKRCRYIYALFIFLRSERYCRVFGFFIDWFDFCRNLLCNDRGNDLTSEILLKEARATQFFMSCNWWNRIANSANTVLWSFLFVEWNTCYFFVLHAWIHATDFNADF